MAENKQTNKQTTLQEVTASTGASVPGWKMRTSPAHQTACRVVSLAVCTALCWSVVPMARRSIPGFQNGIHWAIYFIVTDF